MALNISRGVESDRWEYDGSSTAAIDLLMLTAGIYRPGILGEKNINPPRRALPVACVDARQGPAVEGLNSLNKTSGEGRIQEPEYDSRCCTRCFLNSVRYQWEESAGRMLNISRSGSFCLVPGADPIRRRRTDTRFARDPGAAVSRCRLYRYQLFH